MTASEHSQHCCAFRLPKHNSPPPLCLRIQRCHLHKVRHKCGVSLTKTAFWRLTVILMLCAGLLASAAAEDSVPFVCVSPPEGDWVVEHHFPSAPGNDTIVLQARSILTLKRKELIPNVYIGTNIPCRRSHHIDFLPSRPRRRYLVEFQESPFPIEHPVDVHTDWSFQSGYMCLIRNDVQS